MRTVSASIGLSILLTAGAGSAFAQAPVTPSPTFTEVVDVRVTTPAELDGAPEVVKTTTPGIPKLDRLRRLNTSARNCARHRSEICVFLKNDMSNSANPGPTRTFLPTFP